MRVISKKSRKLGSDQSFAALVLSAPAVFFDAAFYIGSFWHVNWIFLYR